MSFDGKGFLKEIKNEAINKATAKITTKIGDALGAAASKLPGDIFGDGNSAKQGRIDPFKKIDENPFMGSSIAYPEDLGNASSAHYVQFFINEQVNASVEFAATEFNAKAAKAKNSTTSQGKLVGAEQKSKAFNVDLYQDLAIQPNIGNVGNILQYKSSGAANTDKFGNATTDLIKRAPTKRLASSIAMYMPSQVSMSQVSNYGETEIGGFITATTAAGKAFDAGEGSGIAATAKKIINAAGAAGSVAAESAGEAFQASLDTAAAGKKAKRDLARGKITNNRMELIFEGTSRRDFNFSFKMMPKSESEADKIAQIVRMFRFYMAPSFDGPIDVRRTFIVPATFDIEYRVNNIENFYLNKISTCVLTSCNVVYGGERTQFFRPNSKGAPPVETQIDLTFKELEVITRERIQAGF